MANVRAEILAASRARTGWHDEMPVVKNNTASNCRPYISERKASFENANEMVTQEIQSPHSECNNKVKESPSTSPVKRQVGVKIEKMKKLISSDGNGKVRRKSNDENSAPPIYKSDSLSRNESHLTRFNNARAMFERLEEQNSRGSATSPVGKTKRRDSGSSSPSRCSPLRSPCSPSHSFDNIHSRRNSSSSNSSSSTKEVMSPRERSQSSSGVLESSHFSKKLQDGRKIDLHTTSAAAAIADADSCQKQINSPPLDSGLVSAKLVNAIDASIAASQTVNSIKQTDTSPTEHSANLQSANLNHNLNNSSEPIKKSTDSKPQSYSWKRPGSSDSQNPPYRYQSQLNNLSSSSRRRLEDDKQKSQIPSLVSARDRLGVSSRTDCLIKPPSKVPTQLASEAVAQPVNNEAPAAVASDDADDILCVSESGIELIKSEPNASEVTEVNGNIINSVENENTKNVITKDVKDRENMMVAASQNNVESHVENAYKVISEVADEQLPMPKPKSDWRKQLFPDLDSSKTSSTNKIDDNLPESRVDDVVEEDHTVVSGPLTYPEIVLRGICHDSATDLDSLEDIEPDINPSVVKPIEKEPDPPKPQDEEVEAMTVEEANKFLSTNKICANLLSDEEAKEITELLTSQENDQRLMRSQSESTNDTSGSSQRSSDEYEVNPEVLGPDQVNEGLYNGDVQYVLQDPSVNLIGDGHYFIEIEGLADDSDEDNEFIDIELHSKVQFKKKSKVRFSTSPIKVFSTHAVEEYDRRNEDVDPVSASAEYELEKRIEKMDVFPVDLHKGPEGLGLSIIGMGVGADAGLEKLGIFIKTITDGGAACADGRIQVNDQIIEVDGKSLVGVTQAYAASVLRNTAGLVKFLIGRERDAANSEVAQLISQSLEADRERDDRRRALEKELLERQNQYLNSSMSDDETNQESNILTSPLDQPKPNDVPRSLPLNFNSMSNEESISTGTPTPEEGFDMPTCEVFDAEDATSSDYSLSPTSDQDILAMKAKLNENQPKNIASPDILAHGPLQNTSHLRLEDVEDEREAIRKELDDVKAKLEATSYESLAYSDKLMSTQGKCVQLEKKYYKAKKIIREFQLREKNLLQREEFHIQQSQEKDQEYNSLVKTLKDRVILLEQGLVETQRTAGMPVKLPYDRPLQVTPQLKKKFPPLPLSDPFCLKKKLDESESSDVELSDIDLSKYESSPDSDDADFGNRTSTVERKPLNRANNFEKQAVPETDLLDSSAAKCKAELASKGGLANRQPPSMKKQSSSDSNTPSHEAELDGNVDDKVEEVLQSYNESIGEMNRMIRSSDSGQESILVSEECSFDADCSATSSKSARTYNSFSEEIKAAVAQRHAKVVRQMSESDKHKVVLETEYERYQRECYERYYSEYQNQIEVENQAPINSSTTESSEQQQQAIHSHNPVSYYPSYKSQAPPHSQPVMPRPQMPQVHPYSQTQQHQLYRHVYNPPVSTNQNQEPIAYQQCSSSSSLISTSSLQGSTDSQLSNSGSFHLSSGHHGSAASSSSVPSADDRSDDGVVLLSQKQINASLPRPQSRPSYDKALTTGALDSEMSPSVGAKSRKYQINSEESDLESSINSQGKSPATVSSSSYEMQRKPNQWQSGPVSNWAIAQVGHWLLALGMEQYIPKFMDNNVTGSQLLQLDSNRLKSLGVVSSNDRSTIKKKIKEMKIQIEKERKQQEKEMKNKEKQAKKAAKKK